MKHIEEVCNSNFANLTTNETTTHNWDPNSDKESSNMQHISRTTTCMKRIVRRGGSSKQIRQDDEIFIHTSQLKYSTRMPKWPEVHNTVLGELLLEQYEAGNISNNTLKKKCWKELVSVLNRRLNSDYTKTAVMTRFNDMKLDFHNLYQLTNLSGWGWDENLHLPVATDKIWEEIILDNPKWARYRHNPFHQYDIFNQICGGNYATGAGVRSTLRHFNREKVLEASDHQPEDELLLRHDLQFVVEGENESVQVEEAAEPMLMPISRSKRSTEGKSTEKRRKNKQKADQNNFNTLLIRHNDNAELVRYSLTKMCPYTMTDCLTKLSTIKNLTTEALLALNDAINNNNDNKTTLMQWEGDMLKAWIVHIVGKHPLFKDFPVWRN